MDGQRPVYSKNSGCRYGISHSELRAVLQTAVRLFKMQFAKLAEALNQESTLPSSTCRSVVRSCTLARNSQVLVGGKTPLELAFGRPPRSLVPLDTALPSQLCEPGKGDQQDQHLKTLALRAYLEARQVREFRQDLARSLRPSDGPFASGDHVFYWYQDPSKLRAGEWIRATVVSQQGPMVCIDTGSTVLRVNQSLLRSDQDAWQDTLVPLEDTSVSDSVQPPDGSSVVPSCDFLELYSHSARFSEACAAMPDLRVAAPLDLTQVSSSLEAGTDQVWAALATHQPKLVALVPRQRHWRKQQPGEERWQVAQRRSKAATELQLCIQAARHQLQQGKYFIFLHPYCSALWEQDQVDSLMRHEHVHWSSLHFAHEWYALFTNLPEGQMHCMYPAADCSPGTAPRPPRTLEERPVPRSFARALALRLTDMRVPHQRPSLVPEEQKLLADML